MSDTAKYVVSYFDYNIKTSEINIQKQIVFSLPQAEKSRKEPLDEAIPGTGFVFRLSDLFLSAESQKIFGLLQNYIDITIYLVYCSVNAAHIGVLKCIR